MHQIFKRKDYLISVLLHFAPIVFCLEEISLNMERVFNRDTSVKATSLYKLMNSFDFLSSLVINSSILDLILPITHLLQSSEIHIVNSMHLIESLKALFVAKAILLVPFIKSVTVIFLTKLAR